MFRKIQNTYRTLFPTRQLLIRQEGEVKYINASPLLQLSFVLALLASFVWLAVALFNNLTLKDEISFTNNELDVSQHTLNELSLSYQEKQSELELKLEKVEKQQKLLQNVLDSMPSAAMTGNKQSNNLELTSSLKEETSVKNAISNTISAFFSSSDKDDVLSRMAESANKLDKLAKLQETNLVRLDQQIDYRHQSILTAIDKSGLSSEQLLNNTHDVAQGGPLADLALSAMSAVNQELVTKLLNLHTLEDSLSNLPLIFPAKKYYISSRFGIRTDPMNKQPAMHKGIDMAGWIKTKIYAPANGVVRRAGRNGSYGLFIEIDHQNGFMTRYGHLHSLNVKKGQQVAKEDVIGLMGSSGRSTSTHLHYEILFEKKQINPLKLIKALTDVL